VKTGDKVLMDSGQEKFELGCRYYNGDGVPQDYTQDAKHLNRAAEQGHTAA